MSAPVGEQVQPAVEPTAAADGDAKAPAEEPGGKPKRLASLDAFRGFTILGMLLVNNAALDVFTPRQFQHAAWNDGVHFADMVFPWFLLIVGVAIPFAAASHRRKGLPPWRYDLRVLGRAVSLGLLGCLIDSSLARRPVLGLGVLQLIGAAYLVGAALYELPLRGRLALAAGFLVAHWAAIKFLPIPGVGAGVFKESQNLINHLNQVYLGPLGLGGLISVVPASALALIGTAIGDVLRGETSTSMQKTARLLAAGAGLVVIGWLWSLHLPFNKPVWTASYILYAAGWGTLVLGVFYLLIDARGWRGWAFPLVVLGANAIFAYAVPILVKVHLLQEWTVKAAHGSVVSVQQAFMNFLFLHAGRIAGGWLYTSAYIVFWWLVLLWLYRRRIFLRV